MRVLLLGLLDQGENVTHAQDAPGDAVGVELLQSFELLADPDELDRFARDAFYGEGSPATGVAVELGEDAAVEFEQVVEGFGGVDGVLAGHGVEHQVNLMWGASGWRRG